MIAIVIGATGLTGNHLVHQLLNSNKFTSIIAIVRSKTKLLAQLNDPELNLSKLTPLEFDFKDWDLLKASLFEALKLRSDDNEGSKGGPVGFCALGTTIKTAGSQKAFYRVDVEAVVEFAKILTHVKAKKLLVVSSQGANSKSPSFYLRCKGEMESLVSKEFSGACAFLRPGLLLGERTESRFLEQLAVKFTTACPWIFSGSRLRYKPIEAAKVAQRMVLLATSPNPAPAEKNNSMKSHTIENEEIHSN